MTPNSKQLKIERRHKYIYQYSEGHQSISSEPFYVTTITIVLCFAYRILYSVLLGTADNVIWRILSFQYKNNSDLLPRAIILKPQNLSYLNTWLVVVLGFCVGVFLFFFCENVCLFVGLSVYVFKWLCACVFVLMWNKWCILKITKTTQPFKLAPSTWSLKICISQWLVVPTTAGTTG